MREQDIGVRVNIVAVKSNIKDIPNMIEFFYELGVSVFVRRFIPLGRSADVATNFFLDLDEYAWLRRKIGAYLDDPTGVIHGHYLKEEHTETRVPLPFTRRSCSAGQRALVIDPCGKIQLCGFMNQESANFFGNIIDESLDQIWHRIFEEDPIESLAVILESHNALSMNVPTNCFAIAMACRTK